MLLRDRKRRKIHNRSADGKKGSHSGYLPLHKRSGIRDNSWYFITGYDLQYRYSIFSVLSDTDNENKNRRFEENIYSLINFDMVSGVIFLEEEFWSERLRGMITDACFAFGFSNLSHFYHLFRNKFDCSPKKYKEKSTEEN